MNEFKRISNADLNQRAAQVSAGDAQLTSLKINRLHIRINGRDTLDIPPIERSSSTDDPSEDIMCFFAFR